MGDMRAVVSGVGTALGSAGAMTLRVIERMWPATEDDTVSAPRAASHLSLGKPIIGRQLGAAVDRVALAALMTPARFPRKIDYERLQGELKTLHELYSELGYLDDPASFHRAPPALPRPTIRRAWFPKLPFECLSFESGYTPPERDVTALRWHEYHSNRTAHAWVVRHPEPARPWLICFHGLGTGTPWLDFPSFRATHLHRDLGMNLAFPVLPLHGPRRDPGMLHGSLLSFDVVDTIHGMAQAVWDLRRLLSWLRIQGAAKIGLYGISVGALVAALAAGFEDFDLVIAGVPLSDVARLFVHHSPRRHLELAARHDALGHKLQNLYRLISPLQFPPRIAPHHRFIYAGLADRVSTPQQAELLWESWGEPEILWYHSGHVGFFWSRQVERFVDRKLRRLLDSPSVPERGGAR